MFRETDMVAVATKNRLAAVAPARAGINRAGIFNGERAEHGAVLLPRNSRVNVRADHRHLLAPARQE